MGTLHEDLYVFIISSLWILRMRNVSDKSCRENQNKYLMFNILFPRKSCRLWDNVEKYGTAGQAADDNIVRSTRVSCWITKATDTHWQYVILVAFPHQQLLRERTSMLRHAHTARLVLA